MNEAASPEFHSITYEKPGPHIARISLDRPDKRNAQDTRLLYELNEAMDLANADDEVKVIILAANGEHFSSGHDVKEAEPYAAMADHKLVGTWAGIGCCSSSAEAQMTREKEIYLGFSERWRNIAKPTIAQVQGLCISGGLMLVWPCDLIVAGENALFVDNTVDMGICGHEYFVYPWEMGLRQAKEFLFTSGAVDAREAHRLGMVNHVVANERLAEFTLELAANIARKPMFALKMVKEALNAAQDAQGRVSAMQTAFALHQVCHSHNLIKYGLLVDPSGLAHLKTPPQADQARMP
ncbi:enoyl-CoA hydratase [Zestomonas carbonaria]|uniref:Enoyl-CoA hydratase EchA13 n=1 Tax=Zestomonas carbonaria TaxID=2762745 RepID=A0A7U7EL63_9GAMM|nr:enoyl-CoA hydratase [Pseudomonas carbonaria]CAD5106175.1 Putative enoyl-CoA hydratase EchA13 [Pseudomonas carbonaria]